MELEMSLGADIDACLESAVASGVTPGAALIVSSEGKIVHRKVHGLAQRLPDPRPLEFSTCFDLSSLTKVMAATAGVMSLIEAGKMSLEDSIVRHIPGYTGEGKEKTSVADLLIHGSGLPAWRSFFKELVDGEASGGPHPGTYGARAAVMASVRNCPLTQRIGQGYIYSDLGFILLTEVIEKISRMRLDHYCANHIFPHIGLKETFFRSFLDGIPPENPDISCFAATEFNQWLGRYQVAEVHDENAYAMGGVSGHAGLFSTVGDVHTFALTLLRAYQGERGLLYSPETVRDFWRRRVFPNGTMRAYGWDVPSQEGSSAGKYFSDLSFGHLGFTGTSLWIDAAREIIVVLLTNRVHPTRENERIKTVRPAVHDLVMEKLVASHLSSQSSEVQFNPDEEYIYNVVDRNQTPLNHSTPRWIPVTFSRGIPGAPIPAPPREPLSAVWTKCYRCREIMYRPELERNLMVCPHCDHHHYLPVKDRINLLVDVDSFEELDQDVAPMDPLHFVDSKSYRERLVAVQKKVGLKDAFRSGRCRIAGLKAHLGVFDFRFMGGSMGSVVGEKVTRVFEHAVEESTGAVVVSASGGARMQEGVLSLMQMAKSCAALARMKDRGLPFISIMCDPTTGGVAASFAMLGDVNLAEPRALIGFAGPRVIEQTIRQKLPEGFQRSEYLLEHGMVDRIVARKEMRKTVHNIYSMLA